MAAHLKYKSGSSWIDYNLVIYPIGAVYISYTSTSPASQFGGTWTPITGRFPYFNAGTGTGGANSHTHSEGSLVALIGAVDNRREYVAYRAVPPPSGTPAYNIGTIATGGYEGTWSNINHVTDIMGDTGSSSTMPAYQTFYAWRRTA